MTTTLNTSTSLVRSSGDVLLPDGTKRFITVEIQVSVPSGASDAVIAEAVATARRTITMAQTEVHALLAEQMDELRVASQPSDTAAPADDANVVINFGKNQGVPLGNLNQNQLRWYAEMKPTSPDAQTVQQAAARLYSTLYPEG